MRPALVDEVLRDKPLEQRLDRLVTLEDEQEDAEPDVVEDELDPGVVVRVLQTAERLADDVERREVVPRHDVQRAPAGDAAQTLDEEVDVGLDDGLLVLHALGGEAVGEDAAVAGVVLAVRRDGVSVPVVDEVRVLRVLLEPAALAVAHDLLPSARGLEGELGGGHADGVAAAGVEVEDRPVGVSAEEHQGVWEAGGGSEPGARVFAERVEGQVVNRREEEVEEGLGPLVLTTSEASWVVMVRVGERLTRERATAGHRMQGESLELADWMSVVIL